MTIENEQIILERFSTEDFYILSLLDRININIKDCCNTNIENLYTYNCCDDSGEHIYLEAQNGYRLLYENGRTLHLGIIAWTGGVCIKKNTPLDIVMQEMISNGDKKQAVLHCKHESDVVRYVSKYILDGKY